MADNLKRRNAVTSSGSPELEEYRRAKRAYHAAGDAAKGTSEGSPQRAAYAQARADYQRAGVALRATRG